MLNKSLSYISAVLPRLQFEQLLHCLEYFKSKGYQDLPPERLLQKLPFERKISDAESLLTRLRAYLKSCEDLHVFPGHSLYPSCLYELSSPPFFLMLRGNWRALQQTGLSIVGSRRFSFDAASWMRSELKSFLHKSQVSTVSGGAYGVDQEAHQLGLYHGGGTVVVLPSGLDEIYPPQLKNWEKDFLAKGAVFLSEWLPWEKVRPYHFQHRNRLIAALSPGTLVVEAGEKSGTMLTANWAAQLGREVGVLPGSPLEPSFRGSLKLLQAGAALIADRRDLHLWWESLLRAPRASEVPALFEEHGCQSAKDNVGTPHGQSRSEGL